MSMKIPPSERIRQLLEGYLQGGYQQSEQPASAFLKLAAQVVAQEVKSEIFCGLISTLYIQAA